jgi:hypothetical protein
VISDDGQGMTPRTDRPGLGRGLALIANLAGSLEIEHDGSSTRPIMRFTRDV